MKKFITLCLIFLMVLIPLAACSRGGESTTSETSTSDTTGGGSSDTTVDTDERSTTTEAEVSQTSEETTEPQEEDPVYIKEALFADLNASKEIMTIDSRDMTSDQFIMITSLQGIVAQKEARIVITGETCYRKHVDLLIAQGYTEQKYTNPWTLYAWLKKEVKDNGYVKFDRNKGEDINLAAVVAGVEGWLMITPDLEQEAVNRGMVKKYDFTTGDISTMSAIQRKTTIFNTYKDRLNPNGVIHQDNGKNQLRDLGIALKMFCFTTNEGNSAEKAFRETVFKWMNPNSPVMGWGEEIPLVADCSKYGMFVIPMDWAHNASYFAGITDITLKQTAVAENIKYQSGTHYLAIVVSDGDNVQWTSRDFAFTSHFADHVKSKNNYKVTWTFPPILADMNPLAASYVYGMADTYNSFISGVSGAGYINSSGYPNNYLDGFTTLTSKWMGAMDMKVVTLLDDRSKLGSAENIQTKLNYYSRFDNIIGGIWEQDFPRYEAGAGQIYWSNGKPFMSVRVSFWYPEDGKKPTNEWIQGIADKINGFSKNAKTAGGYTILNVHPWSVSMADVDKLVSMLAPHVKIVSAEEIITLAAKNISHE